MALNPKNLGLAGGVLWGVMAFVMSLLATGTGYGAGFVGALGGLYIGYGEGIMGSILGLVYGFLDGFIGLYILGWLYNLFEKKK